MTPLPGPLGATEVIAWRIDLAVHAAGWDSGEGAFRQGGRWNGKRIRTVYCSLDPATAILEVAVHKGFGALDISPHVLTSMRIIDPATVRIVQPEEVPNPNWLVPGIPSAGQQRFGDDLLAAHPFVVLPSTVSRHSWNLIFDPGRTHGAYSMVQQERFALDGRLHRAAS